MRAYKCFECVSERFWSHVMCKKFKLWLILGSKGPKSAQNAQNLAIVAIFGG